MSGAIGAQSVLFAKCTAELLTNTSQGNGFLFAHYQVIHSPFVCYIYAWMDCNGNVGAIGVDRLTLY
jgi:hypothetical protein